MIKEDFSYKFYKHTLVELKKEHNFVFFDKVRNNDVILRHDIDISLEPAVKMAEIEKKLGIKSTFFILLQSPYYNAFSENSIKYVKKIIGMGHRIGLHYDSLIIRKFNFVANEFLKNEIKMMSIHYQTEVNNISSHIPSYNKKLKFKLPKNILDADSEIYKKNRKYVSDSVQNWREGTFSKYVNEKNLYILIHPIWWTEENMSRNEILRELSGGKLDLYKKEIIQLKKFQNEYLNRLKQ